MSKSLRLLYQEGKVQRQGLGKKGDPCLYATVTRNAGDAGDAGDKYIEIPTIPTIPTNTLFLYYHYKPYRPTTLTTLTTRYYCKGL